MSDVHSPGASGATERGGHPGDQMRLLLTEPADGTMHVHASHRMETLADWLAERMRSSPAEPLEPERIVVPDPLLGQWLRLQLAARLGVAAHLKVEMQARFAWNAMRELTKLPEESEFGPAHLRWRIFDELGDLSGRGQAWSEIAGYVAAGDDRMRFELADQLAIAYDRCRVYRPGAIRDWEAGKGTGWHAALWRKLASRDEGPQHWAAAIDRYRDAVRERRRDGARSRRRVSFFHVATLSPTYVDLLHLMASVMEVHLYLLSPGAGFWTGPVASPRAEGAVPRGGASPNELLDAWGQSARELRQQLQGGRDRGGATVMVIKHHEATEVTRATATASCLDAVQRDILLGPRNPTGADQAPLKVPDASIQVHSCHSPTREVEVLHDVLLDLLQENQHSQPADVLVLTPDVDTYAPLIQAVFGASGVATREGKGQGGLIRVNIGTRRLKEGAAMTAFLALLDLPGSRHTATQVMAPLLSEAVRSKFRISPTGLGMLRTAVAGAGIRWGMDASHRVGVDAPPVGEAGAGAAGGGEATTEATTEATAAASTPATAEASCRINGGQGMPGGVPASRNHNWRRGLDRLLLGYAMEPGDVLIRGITPASLEEWGGRAGADDYETLGRFCTYRELACELDGWLRKEATAEEWSRRLREEVVERFFSDQYPTSPEARQEVRTVNGLVDEFAAECLRAGHLGAIPFPVLRDALNALAEKSVRAAPRLADGIAVASLASGQVFPAEVVCAVGMNYGAFPRRPQVKPFDFQAELFPDDAPRSGDPSLRNEDRYAFLEALLAARSAFVATYTGRDLQDDKPRPPSVLVSELTDYLDHRFAGERSKRERKPKSDGDSDRTSSDENQQTRPDWTTQHPLQPFSRRYFEAGGAVQKGDGNGNGDGTKTARGLGLYSYSQPMQSAAETLLTTSPEAPNRFRGRLEAETRTEADGKPTALQLERLVRFSESPSKDFLRYRLGALLETREPEVANDEPFDLNALEDWKLKDQLVRLGEMDADRSLAIMAAGGLLPPRNLGKLRHRDTAPEVVELLLKLNEFTDHREPPPLPVEVELEATFDGGWAGSGGGATAGTGQKVLLVGAVDDFSKEHNELLFWRVGNLRPKDRIATWLKLLAVTCERGEAANARLLGVKKKLKTEGIEGPDPATARKLLNEWVAVWQESRLRPLPFFADTSWRLVREDQKNAGGEATGAAANARQGGSGAESPNAWKARSVAGGRAADHPGAPVRAQAEWPENVRNQWSGSAHRSFSDGRKAWHRLVFPKAPETPESRELAHRLLGPLLKATTR